MKKLLALMFLTSLTGLAFASGPTASPHASVKNDQILAEDTPKADELKGIASEAECAAACRREGYSSYHFIAPKSCTCLGPKSGSTQ